MDGLHHFFFQLPSGHPKSKAMRTDIAQPIRLKDYRPARLAGRYGLARHHAECDRSKGPRDART